MTEPLKLAVVGHTNVGKTSLLRTLTRNGDFGEVSHRPSTTRDVLGARLSVNGEALLELYDTPGLEDGVTLLEHLEQLDRPGERLDGPASGWTARRGWHASLKAWKPASASSRKPRCCAVCWRPTPGST